MREGMVVAILNPVAGGGKTLKVLPQIREQLQASGRPFEIYQTKSEGDGRTAASRFAQERAALVIAVGGDGTIHEVANGLYDCGTRVPLGVIPAGNGSDFARTLGLNKSVPDSIAHALNAKARPMDLGKATFNDGSFRIFINVAGLGFDAMVAEKVVGTKWMPGANLPYLAAALRTLVGYKNIQVAITADDQTISGYSVFTQIANAKYMGGGYKIAPTAEIDDGWLDLAFVGDLSKPELLRVLPKVYSGKHVNHPKFQLIRAKTVRVETIQPAGVQLDGELFGSAPVTFSVIPGAIELAG